MLGAEIGRFLHRYFIFRPVLVLKGLSSKTCVVVPLTTSKQVHPLRIGIGIVDAKEAKVIISQIKVVDTKRFINKIGVLSKEKFDLIRKAVRDLF